MGRGSLGRSFRARGSGVIGRMYALATVADKSACAPLPRHMPCSSHGCASTSRGHRNPHVRGLRRLCCCHGDPEFSAIGVTKHFAVRPQLAGTFVQLDVLGVTK